MFPYKEEGLKERVHFRKENSFHFPQMVLYTQLQRHQFVEGLVARYGGRPSDALPPVASAFQLLFV